MTLIKQGKKHRSSRRTPVMSHVGRSPISGANTPEWQWLLTGTLGNRINDKSIKRDT